MSRYGNRAPLFVLGSYRSSSADASVCRCGRDATHIAAALMRGELLVLLVCPRHASRVDALPSTLRYGHAAKEATR